ncbi:MAG: hypothetical protein E5V51_00200 [Mesorhizobium sp.]|nr:hypothetical protein EOA35_01155 [Mesorhizobium sp. M8A.F.Ca.ET.023.01.1.1]TIW90625.1 MAG: hypothetical protein E5V51_00200 [Mesorhizobium sp.]
MKNRLTLAILGAAAASLFMASFEGEGGGSGGGTPAATPATPATPESILFPKEGGEGGEKPADPPAGDKPADPPAADWKEYEPDATKSEAENAAAKAEHDKTKPAEKSDAEKALDAVPEDGKYTLAMPEGVQVDQELLDALGPKFAAKKLTTREAQELADEFIKIETARGEKRMEDWGKTISGWADTAKKDAEIGGDKWDASTKAAQRAMNRLGTPELRTYLNASGGGNHPELIRIFAKVGAMISEDSPPQDGAGGKGKPVEAAHLLFPNDAPKG